MILRFDESEICGPGKHRWKLTRSQNHPDWGRATATHFLAFRSGWKGKLLPHMGSVNTLAPYIVAEMQTSRRAVNPLPFNHHQTGLSLLAEFGALIICG